MRICTTLMPHGPGNATDKMKQNGNGSCDTDYAAAGDQDAGAAAPAHDA